MLTTVDMAHRSSHDVFGNAIDPHSSSAWTQPAAILSPFLTPSQLQWANLIVTILFIMVMVTLLGRATGRYSISQRCVGCCSHGFVVLRANLVCWWIYFLRAYGEILRVEDECKIVVLGDGLALGFGDFVTFFSKQAGLTRRFQNALDVAKESQTLLLKWRVFNRGHFATNSKDWLPTTTQKPKFHPFIMHPGSPNLFDHVFRQGSIVSDAQIVVVVVGTMDCRGPPGSPGRGIEFTVNNVTEIVQELVARGKHVILCKLHDARQPDDQDQGFIGRHHRKNTAFEKIVGANPLVLAGANFTHVKYHVHRHSDRVHFDPTGYDLACEDMLPVLVQACTKVENAILLQRHLDARVAAQLDQEEERPQGSGTKKDK